MPVRAVMFDFYGTLARATRAVDLGELLARHGHDLPEHLHDMWWSGDLDGIEHHAPSRSRVHYVAWQRERLHALLDAADVHPGERAEVLDELEAGRADRVLEAYPEVPGVLAELRASDLAIVVCSNWDWDLVAAVEEAGLPDCFDVLMSSAWAGARKPHPRIYEHTLAVAGLDAGSVLFVGDTWGPDVEGPRAAGMACAYLERVGHWPDPSAPVPGGTTGMVGDGAVPRLADLRGVLELI